MTNPTEAHSPESDAPVMVPVCRPCSYSWPDRNSVRTHVCQVLGEHETHRCSVCGPSVTPPAVPTPPATEATR